MAILATILATILLVSFVLSAVFLWLAGVVVRAPKASFLRAALATIIASILYVLYVAFSLWMRQELAEHQDLTSRIGRELLALFVFLLATIVVIMRMFETSFLRAFAIWLMNLAPAIVLAPVLFVLLKLL